MSSLPWSKFFWSDWESDQGLRLCSLAAQGMWMRMLCVCSKGEPKGYLAINGQPIDSTGVARLCGVSAEDAQVLMDELASNGVFSRDRRGWIYSRRLVRDAKKSSEGKKNASRRWSQGAEKQDEKHVPNGVANGEPYAKKPEARSQKEYPHTPKGASFADFWASWPNKTGKAAAERAWKKLSPQDRDTASGSARSWFEAWRRKHPDASPIHPASFLNGRRWEDEGQAPVPQGNRLETAASNILSGKDFLCRNIPASLANELVSRGMVTIDQCRKVQVL